MGAIYNILAIRITRPQVLADFEHEYGQTPPTAQEFAIVRDSQDFPENLSRRSWEPWGAVEPSRRYGEAIFLFYYDGGAAELCGTMLYEHAVDGAIARALGFSSQLWPGEEPDPERLMWRRVEGAPEPWEAAAFDFSDAELAAALREAADYGTPAPEQAQALWAARTLQEGQYFPSNVQDRVLPGVRRAFKLW
jgi:hypothetical protein